MFYTILRIRLKGDGQFISNAVQYQDRDAAIRQFFNLLYTDMGDETLVYHSCVVINSMNMIEKSEAFDKRTQEVE